MKEVSIIDDLDTWEGELRNIGDTTEVDCRERADNEKFKVLEQKVLQGNNLEGTYVEPKRYSTPAITSANTAPTILVGQISEPQMNECIQPPSTSFQACSSSSTTTTRATTTILFCHLHFSAGFNDELLDILEKQNKLSLAMALCQDRASLPKKDLTVFDGSDITQFRSFMLYFERIIESKCETDSDRYIYLEQYTSGKAMNLVKSCSYSDSTVAYKRAKGLLISEYGSEHKIYQAYIAKLNNWPAIRAEDSNALHDFLIYLMDCLIFIENSRSINPLDTPQKIMKLVAKLPFRMRDAWRRRAHDLMVQRRSDVRRPGAVRREGALYPEATRLRLSEHRCNYYFC